MSNILDKHERALYHGNLYKMEIYDLEWWLILKDEHNKDDRAPN